MKTLKFPILIILLVSIALLSQCEKDRVTCTTCPPPKVGTPYNLVIPEGFPQPFIPADNPMTKEGVKLGRFLFYDKKLSADLSMSCSSCHKQFSAFSDMGKEKSIGVEGLEGRRHAMALFNLAFQEEFFWDGRTKSLEEQSLHPIKDPLELNTTLPVVISRLEADADYPAMFKAAFGDSKITDDRIAKAIAQFERTIISAGSEFDRVKRLGGMDNLFTETPGAPGSKNRGFEIFNSNATGDCFHCHALDKGGAFLGGGYGKDLQFINNGLNMYYPDDQGRMEVTGNPADWGKFKVPSVRNVDLTFPYMHDGSIPTLDSLVHFYNFGGYENGNIDSNMKFAGNPNGRLTKQDMYDLIAFLKTLTDYEMVQNPAYSNPFLE